MDIAEIQSLVLQHLHRSELPLQLAFYGEMPRPTGGFVVIGDDYETDLCVRLSDGAVYSIDARSQLPDRFVNSSIEKLGQFIALFQSYVECGSSNKEVKALPQRIRNDFEKIDPLAIEYPENWWSLVVEQMEDGLL